MLICVLDTGLSPGCKQCYSLDIIVIVWFTLVQSVVFGERCFQTQSCEGEGEVERERLRERGHTDDEQLSKGDHPVVFVQHCLFCCCLGLFCFFPSCSIQLNTIIIISWI